jgi:outer membrane protein TolC
LVSFDPQIAQQEITKAAAEFDLTAFGRLNYERNDNPVNSMFQPGQSDTRLLQSGVKQRGPTGAEWSLSYALTRTWDDLVGRTLATRYEPMVVFEVRQPLLRDAWQGVNLAGVDIARLNHRIATLLFRQKTEQIAAEVISAYWLVWQARRNLDIQEELLEQTVETLKKVEGRKEIDATNVQIKQAEASARAREAMLFQARKHVMDMQDSLARLMADPQLNVLGDMEIVPVTAPYLTTDKLECLRILELAMLSNPAIQQAKVAIDIADVNIRAAENQKMPRLDLVASARSQGLGESARGAHRPLMSGEYPSYAVGLTLEHPLGNRQREAELLKRRIERRKAVTVLQNLADQVAVEAKERVRTVETSYAEIEVQKAWMEAARIHLRALEDSEAVRERLTPEFLLVKLQAQEALARSRRAVAAAITEFNTSSARLAQTTGTLLDLYGIRTALSVISDQPDIPR